MTITVTITPFVSAILTAGLVLALLVAFRRRK